MLEEKEDHKLVGNNHFKKADYHLAIEAYEKGIKEKPTQELYCNIGLCYLKLEKYEEAEKFFTKALKMNSNYVKAKFNRGICLFKLGKYKEALNDFNTINSNDLKSFDDKIHLQIYLEQCSLHIKSALIFYILDIKFTKKNKVIILEAGDGNQSALDGFDALGGKKMGEVIKEKLKKLNSHWKVHYLNSNWAASDINLEYINKEIKKKSIVSLKLFQENDTDVTKFGFYQHLFFGKNKFLSTQLNPNILQLNMGFATAYVPLNKRLTHEVMSSKYRPKCRIIFKNQDLSEEDIESINNFSGEHIIRKEPTLNQGLGIKIISKDSKLINEDAKNFDYKKKENLDIKLEPCLMIEEIINSKKILYEKDKEEYDPTMRLVFFITGEGKKKKFVLEPIAQYWKFPLKPTEDNNTHEELISSFTEGRIASGLVSEKEIDIKNIWEQVEEAMLGEKGAFPKIWEKNFSIHEDVQKLLQSHDSLKKKEGIQLLYLLSVYYDDVGNKILRKYYASLFIEYTHSHYSYAEMGVFYMDEGDYTSAAQMWEKAIEKVTDSLELESYYELLITCYAKDKQHDKLLTCIKIAYEALPDSIEIKKNYDLIMNLKKSELKN